MAAVELVKELLRSKLSEKELSLFEDEDYKDLANARFKTFEALESAAVDSRFLEKALQPRWGLVSVLIKAFGPDSSVSSALTKSHPQSGAQNVPETAFQRKFVGEGVEKLWQIMCDINKYPLNQWYAHYLVAINSSGWGKSRTFCELPSKNVWVIYCSLSIKGYTYPPQSGISTYLLSRMRDELETRPQDRNIYYGQHRVMVLMTRFYAACLVVLNDWIEATGQTLSPTTFVQWLSVPERHPQAKHFWDAVRTLMEGKGVPSYSSSTTLPWVGTKPLPDKFPGPPPTYHNSFMDTWSRWEFAKAGLLTGLTGKLCSQLSPGETDVPRVLFVFDEAKCLTKRMRNASVAPFVPVRRSVRYLPSGMLAAFVSTNSEVGNFVPPAEADESDKVSGRGSKVPHPIYGIYEVDRVSGAVTAKEARDPNRLVQIGRPQFKAWYEAYMKLEVAGKSTVDEMLQLAADKLLGGSGRFELWESPEEVITDAAALAVAGFRLAVAINPTCQLAREVSAAHMVSVLHVSACRRFVWTGWFMEPLLAEAAARIMGRGNWTGMKKIVSKLQTAIRQQWVDIGYLGELAGRLLLLRAMDMSRDVQGNELFPQCSLDDFIGYLSGQRLSNFAGPERVAEDGELNRLLDGIVSFNFWFKPDHVHLDPRHLREAFLASAAIVCYERTWRIDLVVPVYLGKQDEEINDEHMTAVFVQVRNVKGTDPKLSFSTAEATPLHARMTSWTKRPFLSLYINVSKYSTKGPMIFESGSELLNKVLNKGSQNISKGKLKALIECHPESVAAMGSGTKAAREAFGMTDQEMNSMGQAEKEQVMKERSHNTDIYRAWMGWFGTCNVQYALTIPAPLYYTEKTPEDEVASELLDQVYDLAEAAGPDIKAMCYTEYPQQMDFAHKRGCSSVEPDSGLADESDDFVGS